MTWVVPTVDGREEALERSLAAIRKRKDVEIIEYRNRRTCGQAWVEGGRAASGDYVCFSADDLQPHDGFLEAMIEAVDQDKHPAALVLERNGSKQSCGGVGSDVCRGDCEDWQPVEWSPTPFIRRDWWKHIEPHAEKLASLHYSTDRLVSACLAQCGIPSVMRQPAVFTHFNDPVGRLGTAGSDGWEFDQYRTEHGL